VKILDARFRGHERWRERVKRSRYHRLAAAIAFSALSTMCFGVP
jgi:hypothetical protein